MSDQSAAPLPRAANGQIRFSDISKSTYKPPAKTADTKSAPLKVTAKLRTAVEAMVWQGLQRDDAARSVGLTPNALYAALRKPHVKAYYLGECEVLRTSGRARRIHRLEEISEASSNLNASVQAIRTLDAPDGPNSSMGSGRSGAVTMPGLVIQIIQSEAMGHAIDVEATNNATISTGSVPLVGERRSGEESE